MSKGPFTASMFTATQWDGAAIKARVANQLVAFVKADMPPKLWTKTLYKHLSLHFFHHIAHFNMNGFYDEWFATAESRFQWISRALECDVGGDPAYTWSDVEKAFQRWLKDGAYKSGFLAAAEAQQRRETVYETAKGLAKLDRCLTPGAVDEFVQSARRQVEEVSRLQFDPAWAVEIRQRIIRELLVSSLEFKIAAISSNTNAFGHSQYVFVTQQGECWTATAWRGGCRFGVGDRVVASVTGGRPNFGALGFECPGQRADMPGDLLESVWSRAKQPAQAGV